MVHKDLKCTQVQVQVFLTGNWVKGGQDNSKHIAGGRGGIKFPKHIHTEKALCFHQNTHTLITLTDTQTQTV